MQTGVLTKPRAVGRPEAAAELPELTLSGYTWLDMVWMLVRKAAQEAEKLVGFFLLLLRPVPASLGSP